VTGQKSSNNLRPPYNFKSRKGGNTSIRYIVLHIIFLKSEFFLWLDYGDKQMSVNVIGVVLAISVSGLPRGTLGELIPLRRQICGAAQIRTPDTSLHLESLRP